MTELLEHEESQAWANMRVQAKRDAANALAFPGEEEEEEEEEGE